MPYTPLARKYRPGTFDELVGQSHVTATLKRALEQKREAQAYLFAGLRGVGKTSAARILAKALNCEQGPTPDPCQRCASCLQVTQGNHLDVTEIDGASNRGIDEIRSLRETVPYAPTAGRFHIYIIDEVHMLTTEAFNALLKTLEEPPPHVKFVFATTAPSKVPATILSRCQRFDFRRIEAGEMVRQLSRIAKAEKIQADDAALFAIARASDGSLRDAEVVLDQLSSFVSGTIREPDVTELLGSIGSEALMELTQAILDHDAPSAIARLSALREQGKDAPELLGGLLRHVRNLLLLLSIRGASDREALVTRLVDEPAERLKLLEAQAGRSTPQELLFFLQVFHGAYDLVRRSPLGQMILELAVIKLATREAWQSLEDLVRRVERLAGESAGASGPAIEAPGPAPKAERPRAASTPAPVPPRLVTKASSGAPAMPVAAPTPAGPELQPLVEIWPSFLQRLGERKMSLAAFLADSRPVRKDGATLAVGLPGSSLHHELLSAQDNKRLIEQVLADAAGARLSVQFETLTEPVTPAAAPTAPVAADSSAPALVQDIVKLFNATVVDAPNPKNP